MKTETMKNVSSRTQDCAMYKWVEDESSVVSTSDFMVWYPLNALS